MWKSAEDPHEYGLLSVDKIVDKYFVLHSSQSCFSFHIFDSTFQQQNVDNRVRLFKPLILCRES